MTRFITLANSTEVTEIEFLALQLTDYDCNKEIAESLLDIVTKYCTDSIYDFKGYINAKKRLSCTLNVDMCEISRLCILTRKVNNLFLFKGYSKPDASKIGYTMTVEQLISSLLALPNQQAYVSFYAPESPCPVKSVHVPNYDTSHVYLDYKA